MRITKIGKAHKRDLARPILPTKRYYKDPTRQGVNRSYAIKQINKAYKYISKEVDFQVNLLLTKAMDLYDLKKTYDSTNLFVNKKYFFDVDEIEIEELKRTINNIFDRGLEIDGKGLDREFWLSSSVSRSYNTGAEDAVRGLASASVAAGLSAEFVSGVRTTGVTDLLSNPQYLRRVGLVAGRSFNLMSGLSADSTSNLLDALTRGMSSGQGIKDIRRDIMDRVKVSKSRAERIARTEINGAYRTATRQETEEINESLFNDQEYEMRLLWFSALSPTTRETHAERHGKTFTPEEVAEFYMHSGNAINCLCSQVSVLVHKETGEPVSETILKEMRDDRAKFYR